MKKIKPVRLQRKRTKGFHLESPNGLDIVYVGRPSKWGNPYSNIIPESKQDKIDREDAVEFYWCYLHRNPRMIDDAKKELCGKNISCWCPLDQPCHADVLLELANSEVTNA